MFKNYQAFCSCIFNHWQSQHYGGKLKHICIWFLSTNIYKHQFYASHYTRHWVFNRHVSCFISLLSKYVHSSIILKTSLSLKNSPFLPQNFLKFLLCNWKKSSLCLISRLNILFTSLTLMKEIAPPQTKWAFIVLACLLCLRKGSLVFFS